MKQHKTNEDIVVMNIGKMKAFYKDWGKFTTDHPNNAR